MITTKRSTEATNYSYEHQTSNASVALLEREEVKPQESAITNENLEQVRAKMQSNLDKLLNYDRYNEEVKDSVVEEVAVVDQSFADEDIRPTSTTMQFGDGDIQQMYKEMNKQQTEEASGAYKLSGKGKFVVVMYALVIAVVMAIIVINSGLLNSRQVQLQSSLDAYNSKVATYQTMLENAESLSNPDYIIEQAKDLGMILGQR